MPTERGRVTRGNESDADQGPNEIEIFEIQDEAEEFGGNDAIPAEIENVAVEVVPVVETEEPVAQPRERTEADRRAYPRYSLSAVIELIAGEKSTKLRLRDLSLQGCYVDTDCPYDSGTITDIRVSKNTQFFDARATVVYNQPGKGMGLKFTTVPPEQPQTVDMWIAESRKTSWLESNRRRNQRVLLKMPVRMSGPAGSASPAEQETHTLAISNDGAMIVLAGRVSLGQRFTLVNVQTQEALDCVVVHLDEIAPQQFHVGVEFAIPNAMFWRVAFPPRDWTPHHPDAKSV